MKEKKWYNKPSNWLFIIALIVLIPILIINMYIMFQANTEKDKVPDVFGYKPFIVLSGSMETEIHVGDLIIAKIVNPNKLKKDDVIAFRDEENTVTTHRIIEIVEKDDTKYFVTKGDNNSSQDQNLVELKDVEGIYVMRIPGIGTMMNELSKPTTIIIVLLGITIIFVLSFSISNRKLRDQEEKEFLEYKKMKEEEKKKVAQEKKKETKKVATKEKKDNNKKSSASKKSTNKKTPAKKTEKKKTTSKKKTSTTKSRKHS